MCYIFGQLVLVLENLKELLGQFKYMDSKVSDHDKDDMYNIWRLTWKNRSNISL